MRTSTIAGILFLFFLVPLTTPSTVGADTVIDGISFGDSKVNVRLKTLKSDRMNQPLERRGPSALSPIGKVDLTVESHAFDLIYFFN